MGHWRHETLHFSDPILRAVYRLLTRLYAKPPDSTLFELNEQRNKKIRQCYTEGEGISDLVRSFDLSPQRIYQIIKRKHH
jgi:hypothetical protein